MPRSIGGKHPHLTILHFAQGATVLPGHAYRVLAFFDKARLIDDQHAIGLPHLVCHEVMIRLTHRVLIPHIIAHAALHAPNVAPVDAAGHGLNGFAFQGTEWADQVVEKIPPGPAPPKTAPEGAMKARGSPTQSVASP